METNYYFIFYIRLLDCFPSVSKHHYLYYCIYSWRHSSTFSICLIVCHRQRFTCYVHKILDYAPNEMMNNKYYIWLTSKLDTKKISSEEKKQSMVFINIRVLSVPTLSHTNTPTDPEHKNEEATGGISLRAKQCDVVPLCLRLFEGQEKQSGIWHLTEWWRDTAFSTQTCALPACRPAYPLFDGEEKLLT